MKYRAPLFPPSKGQGVPNEPLRRCVTQWHKHDVSCTEMALLAGVSHQRIHQIVRALGLPRAGRVGRNNARRTVFRIGPNKSFEWNYIASRGARSVYECWPWVGARHGGSGIYRYGSTGNNRGAHRVAWEYANGRKLRPGECVCHACDNPVCVNPAHLWVGSHRDNIQDSIRKGRWMSERRREALAKRSHKS